MDFVYVIKRWDSSGFVKKNQNDRGSAMPWVAIPTKHDGKGFLRLARIDQDGSIYGIWILLVAIAGKCIARGVLADEDGPLTEDDLALKMCRDVEAVTKALEILTSEKIGWIEKVPASSVLASGKPTAPNETKRNGTEHDTTCSVPSPGESLEDSPDRSENPQTGSQKKSVFGILTADALQNERKLRGWFDWQRSGHGGKPVFEEADWPACKAMATHAVEKGRKPIALFVKLASSGEMDKWREA